MSHGTASEVDEVAPAYRLEIKGLYDLTATTVEELHLPYPEDQGGHPFKHTPHSLILALRDKVKALTAQPSEVEQELRVSAAMIEGLRRKVEALANDRLTADAEAAQLRGEVERLRAEIAEARRILGPTNPKETLIGAIRNLQQAHVSERDSAERLDTEVERLAAELASPPVPSGWQQRIAVPPPEDGLPFLAYGPELVDEDYTPDGIVEACYSDGGFIGAIWNNSSDEWMTEAIEFTHWMRVRPPEQNAVDALPSAPDAIAAAVRAELEPLADALIEAGHKLARKDE